MKKLFFIPFVLGVFAFSSCGDSEGGKASEIKVSDIDSECGCVEAMDIVMNEMIESLGGKKINEFSEDDLKALEEKNKPLEDKAEEIKKHCKEKFPNIKRPEEIKNCPAVEKLKKTMEKMMAQY